MESFDWDRSAASSLKIYPNVAGESTFVKDCELEAVSSIERGCGGEFDAIYAYTRGHSVFELRRYSLWVKKTL